MVNLALPTASRFKIVYKQVLILKLYKLTRSIYIDQPVKKKVIDHLYKITYYIVMTIIQIKICSTVYQCILSKIQKVSKLEEYHVIFIYNIQMFTVHMNVLYSTIVQ